MVSQTLGVHFPLDPKIVAFPSHALLSLGRGKVTVHKQAWQDLWQQAAELVTSRMESQTPGYRKS